MNATHYHSPCLDACIPGQPSRPGGLGAVRWISTFLFACLAVLSTAMVGKAQNTHGKDYYHWADGGSVKTTPEWVGGNLHSPNSSYAEGTVVPHVLVLDGAKGATLKPGESYSFDIKYDYMQANSAAGGFTEVTAYNADRAPASLTASLPVQDAAFTVDNSGNGAFSFYTVNADVTDVTSPVSKPAGNGTAMSVTVRFIYTGLPTGRAEVYFGLRLAQAGFPSTYGASHWTGASLQTTVDSDVPPGARSLQIDIQAAGCTPPAVGPNTGTAGICGIGNTTQLSNALSGGIWESSDAAVATVDPATGLVTAIGEGTAVITYRVTDGNCRAYASTDIVVNPLPAAPTAENQTECVNPVAPQKLTATATPPNGADVVWYTTATLTTKTTAPTQTGVGTSTYWAAAVSAAGCESATRTPVTLTIFALPTALATPTNETCEGLGSITVTGTNGSTLVRYVWSKLNGTGSGYTELNPQPSASAASNAALNLTAGTYAVTITNENNCSKTLTGVVVANNCVQYCSLTQGGYGNPNGNLCGNFSGPSPRVTMVDKLLSATNTLVIGNASRSVTFASAACIIQYLPAGGTPGILNMNPGNVTFTSACSPSNNGANLIAKGKFNNVLLGQTVTLALNTRYDVNLLDVPLTLTMTTYSTSAACNGIVNRSSPTFRAIPPKVIAALGANATVGGLLTLAKNALGDGSLIASDINVAVTAINELFDNCRMFTKATSTTSVAGRGALAGSSAMQDTESTADALKAYPNPFTTATTLEFALPETTRYTLTVYDLKGSVVSRVSSGEAKAGARNSFSVGENLQSGVYVARLVTDRATQTIRINLVR